MNRIIKQCLTSSLIRTRKFWPDKLYLTILCYLRLNYFINWNHPKTFNEKLQWLKLYYRDPVWITMVDKFLVKDYVKSIIGSDYIIPTLGVWDSYDKIDFSVLPDQFVLKCNHNSGGIVICKDKTQLDLHKTSKIINQSLAQDYFFYEREWPYKSVNRKIVAEELLVPDDGEDLKDYKFFCFNGQVKCFKIDLDRYTAHRANYYDRECNLLGFGEKYYPPLSNREVKMPSNINIMISLAEKLSRNIPFVRVDFYNVDGKIYFGEMTFFPSGGTCPYTSYSADLLLGSWLDLPNQSIR